ncbi:hypothetical protein O8B39_17465 [Agrobacterium rhizogenes]|nr:hypothetical protein [Rhizobium rhizogenes]
MNTVQILKEARALIADEKNWTQGAFARDANGRSERIDRAICFCSIGAIAKVARTNLGSPVPAPVLKALGVTAHCRLAQFNDSHTHPEVLALFDRAIARAESEAA